MSGPFGSTAWMANPASGFYDFEISNSLRFEDGDSAYLNRTPSSAGNRRTWTFSTWVKRANLGVQFTFFGARGNNANEDNSFQLVFKSSDAIAFGYGGGVWKTTTQLFRDPSAWLHVVFALDTTQGTGADRTKLYINGTQVTSFTVSNTPGHNLEGGINKAIAHRISHYAAVAPEPFDGYLAETCLIDGTALTGSSFGELKNDIWIPKDTSGLTFGTNGFRLEYKQVGTGTASTSTIGADTSGEDNHWTSNSLVASDVVIDSPTSNFTTLNSIYNNASGPVLSEGNLKYACSTNNRGIISNNQIPNNGKWYYEYRTINENDQHVIGLNVPTFDNDASRGGAATAIGISSHNGNSYNGSNYGSGGASYASAWASGGDVVGVAIDRVNDTIKFRIDNQNSNAFYGTIAIGSDTEYFAFLGTGGSSSDNSGVFNFGADSTFLGTETAGGNADENGYGDFLFAVPDGYLALVAQNFPIGAETIDPAEGGSPQDYFNTVLYTGTGNALDVNTVGFQPDWVWLKQRNAADQNVVFDSIRGVGNELYTNLTNGESGDASSLTAFDSEGFNLGNNGDLGRYNENASTYVAWNWKAETAFSNDASSTSVGNTDSSGTVNTDAGFSIIKWTGVADGSTRNIAHGLGAVPKMIIVKNRERAVNWAVYHEGIGNTKALHLDTTSAAVTDASGWWASTTPTSTVFTTGHGSAYRTGGGGVTEDFIAYCFAEVDGYSKIGTYTGNGNADGTFVYTGFRPAWVVIKSVTSETGWRIYDSKRLGYNVTNNALYANDSGAEDAANDHIDLTSNGFKMRRSNVSNTDGTGYIFMAFAEQPFKYANAR